MLKSMRDSVKTPFIKGLLIVLVLSFISFYGFNRVRSGCGSDSAAVVNGETIGLKEYFISLKNTYEFYKRLGMFKGDQGSEMMDKLKGMVLENLINSRLKIQEAKELGLSVSNIQLGSFIKSQFSDPKTQEFNQKYYNYYLKQAGMTSEQFEETQRERLLADKLDDFVKKTAKISEQEVRENYRIKNEQVNLSYIKINPDEISSGIKAGSKKELEDFYKNNIHLFKTPEKRKIEYLYINPEDFIDANDGDLRGYYENTFSKNKNIDLKSRRVRASHILFKNSKDKSDSELLKEANEVLKKIKHGSSFEAFAAKLNSDATRYKGGDLGYFGRGKMAKEFEAKAFSMKIGEISDPVKTSFGYHLIKIADIIPEGEPTFERLRNEVALSFLNSVKMNPEKFKPFADKMNEVLNGVKKELDENDKKELSDYKDRDNFHWGETDFLEPSGRIEGVSDSAMLLRAAFGLKKGATSSINTGFVSKSVYLVRVKDIRGPETLAFEKVEEKVKEEYAKSKALNKAKELADKIIVEVSKNPESFKSVANKNGLNVVETGLFKRNSSGRIPILGNSQEIMNKAFTLTHKKPVMNNAIKIGKSFFVVSLKDKKEADMKKFDEEKKALLKIALEEKQNDLLQSWMKDAREKSKITKYGIPSDYRF